MGRAAGIMFRTKDGMILLMRRGDGGDYPFHFVVPGGHLSDGETEEEAARREAEEETGQKYEGKLELLYDDGQFCTYLAAIDKEFDVKLCPESTGYVWCKPQNAPAPLHPGMATAFRVACAHTELDIGKLIAEGLLSSPQVFANMHLLALRITGTGLAFRSAIGEHVWRDQSLYLNEDFLQRCNGLTVIMDHPDGSILTSKEYKDRAIGSVMLPYIKGDEVWGIARIYDEKAMAEICEGDISTSPSVVFDETANNVTFKNEEGEPLLIEGRAFLLDHIAIVTKKRGSRGVWDKGGEPKGVELNNPEVSKMSENTEVKADASGEKLDVILSYLSSMSARIDALEHEPEEPVMKAADKKRKDDDEEEMMPPVKADKKRKDDDDEDDMKKDDDDDAACDDDDDEEMEVRAGDKKADKKRKDAKRKDAEGSNPVEHGKAGEMKPDDDDEDDMKKDDDDDQKLAAKHDAVYARYADVQAKADSVLAAFGKSASRPLQGESVTAYRKRLLRGLQGYSDAYKSVNVRAISDKALLDIAEKQIFADALAAAKSPVAYGDQLIEHRTTDRAGRTISTFTGSVGAWLDQFKVAPMRAMEFRTQNVNNR